MRGIHGARSIVSDAVRMLDYSNGLSVGATISVRFKMIGCRSMASLEHCFVRDDYSEATCRYLIVATPLWLAASASALGS